MEVLNQIDIQSEVVKLMALHSNRKHDEAKELANGIFEYFESNSADHLKGIYFFTKGMSFHVQGKFKEAIGYFEKGLLSSNDEGDLAAINHLASGFSNRSLGYLDEAVNHIFLATEKLNPQGPLKDFFKYCYLQLGDIHVSINEHKIALDYFNKSLALSEENNAVLFNAIGVCYQSMKQYEQSKEFHQKALNEKKISTNLTAKAQNDLGVLHLELNELSQAEDLLRKSIQLREENNLEDAACTSMFYLAETYLKQNKIQEALDLLSRCKVITEKYHTKWKEIKILHLMARAHSLNQDHKTANEYYERFNTLQNEVKGEQEKNIFKLKNEQIEKQKKIIQEKHQQLTATFEEIKHLKINRKAVFFSWVTVIVLVLVSEMFLDPFIENFAYNNLISLIIKIGIALLFKPLDGMYESILWNKAIKKVE